MTGNDVDGIFDGLVEGDGGFVIVQKLVKTGMGAGDDDAVIRQHPVDFLGGMTKETGKFNKLVADGGYFGERAGQIIPGDVAYRIHLQSVFHDDSSFLCARRRSVVISIP